MSETGRDPELRRRNLRTGLGLAALALAFMLGFVVKLWLK